MQIIITGGAGFLGQRLCAALVNGNIDFDELVLADVALPQDRWRDPRVRVLQTDLAEPGAAHALIGRHTAIVFHLAAVVSSQAEKEFDLGWRVNLEITRTLLEACRHQNPAVRFVFASSLAVYGGKLPAVVDDSTAVTPQSSYGTQKAIGELLVNDYSRKKFVDGRVLRLPTICVRPGKPNQAASSFVSSIIREPLNGEVAVCPVSPGLPLWLSSPDTVIRNIIHAATLESDALDPWRVVNLPGIGVTVQEMIDALERNTDRDTVNRIQFRADPSIDKIVSSWPSAIDNTRALTLGFAADEGFDEFIRQYKMSTKPEA